jgi:hypothetical protein
MQACKAGGCRHSGHKPDVHIKISMPQCRGDDGGNGGAQGRGTTGIAPVAMRVASACATDSKTVWGVTRANVLTARHGCRGRRESASAAVESPEVLPERGGGAGEGSVESNATGSGIARVRADQGGATDRLTVRPAWLAVCLSACTSCCSKHQVRAAGATRVRPALRRVRRLPLSRATAKAAGRGRLDGGGS